MIGNGGCLQNFTIQEEDINLPMAIKILQIRRLDNDRNQKLMTLLFLLFIKNYTINHICSTNIPYQERYFLGGQKRTEEISAKRNTHNLQRCKTRRRYIEI